jgi:hypothetical protein
MLQAISNIERIGCGRFLEYPLARGSIDFVDLASVVCRPVETRGAQQS